MTRAQESRNTNHHSQWLFYCDKKCCHKYLKLAFQGEAFHTPTAGICLEADHKFYITGMKEIFVFLLKSVVLHYSIVFYARIHSSLHLQPDFSGIQG